MLTMRRFFNDDDNANLLFNFRKLRFFSLSFFRRVLINANWGNGDGNNGDGDNTGAERFMADSVFFTIDDALSFVSNETSRRRRNANLSIFDVFTSRPSLNRCEENWINHQKLTMNMNNDVGAMRINSTYLNRTTGDKTQHLRFDSMVCTERTLI